MNSPIVWIILPAVASVLLLLVQQERTRFFLFSGASLFFALSTFLIKIDPIGEVAFYEIEMRSELPILGRSFILAETDILLIRLVYFFNAIWGIFAYFFRHDNRIVPLGLLFSSMLLAAYAVTPFLYAALIIALAVILSIPLISNNQNQRASGVSRLLIYQALALPFILLAGWFLAGGEVTPVSPEQLIQATLLLGLGFILWLGVFPFHSWIPLLYREEKPINLGYILQLLVTIIFLLILKFTNGFSWLRQYSLFFDAMLLLGIIMADLGSAGIVFQKNLNDMSGYTFLHMVGMLLVTLGLYPGMETLVFPSMLSIFLINISLLHISLVYMSSESEAVSYQFLNTGKWNFFALFGFAFALFTISGMPLTIGFPPIQWIYQNLYRSNLIFFWFLLLSKIFIAFSAFRIVKIMYDKTKNLAAILPKQTRDWVLFILIISVILIGSFSQGVYRNFDQLLTGFENLIQ